MSAMMDTMTTFAAPAVAEFEAAGLDGWHLSAVQIGQSVIFARDTAKDLGVAYLEFRAREPESSRWAHEVPFMVPMTGPTLAVVLEKARAHGWKP
jgi:hypothetical protein